MYAVIRTGGKQYKVKAGESIRVEKLENNLGDEVKLTDVLFVSGETSHFGSPLVKDASVTAVVTQQSKNPKIIIFKRRRRQGYRRLTGHRQPYTELFIKAILAPNGEKGITEQKAIVKDPAKKAERLAAAQAAGKTPATKKAKVAAAPKKKAAAPKAKKVAKKTSAPAKKKAAPKKK